QKRSSAARAPLRSRHARQAFDRMKYQLITDIASSTYATKCVTASPASQTCASPSVRSCIASALELEDPLPAAVPLGDRLAVDGRGGEPPFFHSLDRGPVEQLRAAGFLQPHVEHVAVGADVHVEP